MAFDKKAYDREWKRKRYASFTEEERKAERGVESGDREHKDEDAKREHKRMKKQDGIHENRKESQEKGLQP